MKSVISLVCSLAIFQTVGAGNSIPRYFHPAPNLSSRQIQRELGRQLSKTTSILGQNDNRFENSIVRWDVVAVPRIQVVIEPGQESDIPKIVKYCNRNNVDFLTYNRGHGFPISLGSFNGIQINMVNLNHISVKPGGKSAWFGGGAYDGQVSRYLWDQGYVTTTGSCDCVGMMGPGLGGGHGRHEGLYGMISDNILQVNLVLADGSSIRVNKARYNDLLWGLKGAGHNFGIVTSFEMNIYPRGPDTWHFHTYLWPGSQLTTVFNALNTFHNNGSTPINMTINFGQFYINSSVSATEPSIGWTFAYRGPAEEAENLLAPFNAIQAVGDIQGDVPYPDISVAQGTGEEGFLCQSHNTIRTITTAGLQVYNVTAQQQIFDSFKQHITDNPQLAVAGLVVMEGYSTAAVEAIPSDSSAYPFRSDHHLVYFSTILAPNAKPSLIKQSWKWANEVRDLWNNGQPRRLPNAYVNYANGLEPLEQKYGHEPWRLQRLRHLKAKYDPHNRFRFYNPIV
ncbi:hypothetical protein BJ875DRAFT_509324 [Amylocarpus encephaloides]|uniref:FAD-binding PCMH-type domain-containing protein n=1 Tax=Amylocarpus encephaloides TaxID=45428 RepID=A0A9P7YJ76_9HELO|nr:hypothetical protein BJ875DRAFT_509324 [Amylocarpus encephaloides]